MKKLIIIIILSLPILGFSQSWTAGAGYFGHTATYPGVVLELDREQNLSQQFTMHARLNLGFYHHKRYNNGVFTDISYGFRVTRPSGLYLEQYVGAGLLQTILSADGVYSIDGNGELVEESKLGNLEFMPSIQLGIGYQVNEDFSLWLRPKLFWQVPHKTSSLYNVAVMVGVSKVITNPFH